MIVFGKWKYYLCNRFSREQNSGRLHEWDEENRLRFVLGEKFAGYYGYDANGERVYKLTGISNLGQVNSGSTQAQAILDDAVLYPNPYMVVTPKGYTKHYYAGTERLATVIGGFDEMGNTIESFASQEEDLTQIFKSNYGLENFDPFHYANTLSEPTSIEDIEGAFNENLEYTCGNYALEEVDVLVPQDILYDAVYLNLDYIAQEKDFYFYHGDHLGSANWITDVQGER